MTKDVAQLVVTVAPQGGEVYLRDVLKGLSPEIGNCFVCKEV
jgi:hypothetical protein